MGKNKKNVIKLSSAELAQRVVKVQLGPSIMFTLIWTLSTSLYRENISILLFIYLFIYIVLHVYKWLEFTISIDSLFSLILFEPPHSPVKRRILQWFESYSPVKTKLQQFAI